MGRRETEVAGDGPAVVAPLGVEAAGVEIVLEEEELVHRAHLLAEVEAGIGGGDADRVAVDDGGVGEDIAERQTLDAEAALGLVELDVRVEEVAAEREFVARPPFQRGDQAVTDVVAAALERLEAERDIVLALAVAVEVGEAVGLAEDVGARRRHRLAAARIAQGDAELIVGELVDIGDAGDPAERIGVGDLVGLGVVVAAQVDGDARVRKAERAHRAQVDLAGDGALDLGGGRRLEDEGAVDQLGRILLVADVAAGLGRGDLAPVQQSVDEIGSHAANADRGAVAAVAIGGDAGQAGQQFGDARLGQQADLVGREHFLDTVGLTLLSQRLLQRQPVAGDENLPLLILRFGTVGKLGIGRRDRILLRHRRRTE